MNKGIEKLYETVLERKITPVENSYTCYLLEQGLNKILKKCGEECSEVIIAAKDEDKDQLQEEICDLLYHLVVLMVEQEVDLKSIDDILMERSKRIGNKKAFKDVNTDS